LTSRITNEGIVYTLTIPTNVFGVLDTLIGTFEVLNSSPNERRFDFPNQQQFGFLLMGSGPTPALSQPFIVAPAFSNFILQAGEKKMFSIQSLFRNFEGRLVDKGEYTLEVYLLNRESPRVSLQITVL
jgi:hypothetical protein